MVAEREDEAVSIHAPARGATCFVERKPRSTQCFNPRAREGRDETHRGGCGIMTVSIHAPARGATRGARPRIDSGGVSIHAPARGATLFAVGRHDVTVVSIHAPARGATLSWRIGRGGGDSFNPRAREGRDLVTEAMKRTATGFNPRAREGRDTDGRPQEDLNLSFNPRAREGRDRPRRLSRR